MRADELPPELRHAFARLIPLGFESDTINKANRDRIDAEPGDSTGIILLMGKLPDPHFAGAERFWRAALHLALVTSGRLLAALLHAMPLEGLTPKELAARRRVLDQLRS